MRKAPFRPDNEISQRYTSGVCSVYRQSDKARPGYAPKPELSWKASLRYEEQRLGVTRYYAARQVDMEVERVIRVPKPPAERVPNPQDVVRMEDGSLFRIDLVQTVPGVYPPSLDLTLRKYVQKAGLPAGGGETDNPHPLRGSPFAKGALPAATGTKGE